ncbi:MAG: ATP-dependent zinc metalloprotease FtsH [Phycisphaeraceae bacterium]
MADQNKNAPKRTGDDDQGPTRGPQRPPQPPASRNMGWLMLIALAVVLLFVLTKSGGQPAEVQAQKFLTWASEGRFKDAIVIEDTRFIGTLSEKMMGLPEKMQPPFKVYMTVSPQTKAMWLQILLDNKGPLVMVQEDPGTGLWVHMLISWGPFIILAFLIYFFVFRSIRNAGGGGGMLGSFGRSRHRMMTKEHSNITLNDVAGIDEAKDEVAEIIEFLKNPKKFQRLGGRVPRGVLLIGSPGCGKTLLAKAVAGEADVPFFSISGSDFVEMFVGVGASRVRDLFKQAKDNSPCIIFLDEIDAVGRRRGSGFSSGGHDEREQTLNAILVEMDGFDTNDQVIVVAATNRADILDPALTRPGRFDRQIQVPLPDVRGRYEILKVHAKRIKTGPDVNLEKLARGTPMFSGADLSAIINEAAIGATLQNKDYVEHTDLEEARDKVKWGRALKSRKVEEDEKKVIAYHEAGHAIIMHFDPDQPEPLHKVTIIPRGEALGVTFMLPSRDRYIRTRKYLLGMMRMTFGGRIAEDMFCGDISSGAAGDIRQATSIARAMIMHYGMSEKLGFQLFGNDDTGNPWEQPEKAYSDDTARLIDAEVKSLIDQTYSQAKTMLEGHREQLQALAEALLKYETLTGEEVDKLMKGEPLNKSTVSDLLRAEQDKGRQPKVAPPQEDLPGGGRTMPSPA